jgi:hypothetical protein
LIKALKTQHRLKQLLWLGFLWRQVAIRHM